MVPRKKIRAYLARVFGGVDHSSVSVAISRVYSGFVHAASPQIMDLCGGNPPRFHLSGMTGTRRIQEHRRDAWNYYYRALLSVMTVAGAFRDQDLVGELREYVLRFQEQTGIDGGLRDRTET